MMRVGGSRGEKRAAEFAEQPDAAAAAQEQTHLQGRVRAICREALYGMLAVAEVCVIANEFAYMYFYLLTYLGYKQCLT